MLSFWRAARRWTLVGLAKLIPQAWGNLLVVGLVVGLGVTIAGCSLPVVRAEDRLFLPLTATFADAANLPATPLDGVPVGGLSALVYDRAGDRFLAQSDDRATLGPARFYTLKINFGLGPEGLPAFERVAVERVTALRDEAGQPWAAGSLDPEGLALSPRGTLFISSEGDSDRGVDPWIREFDRPTGQAKAALPLPARYLPRFETPAEEPAPRAPRQLVQGIRANLGFEGLTIEPGGGVAAGAKTALEPFRLFAAVEDSLAQDVPLAAIEGATPSAAPKPGRRRQQIAGERLRLLHFLLGDGPTVLVAEHLYLLDPTPPGAFYHGLSELLSIDRAGHFLSLERTYHPLEGHGVKLFQLALGGATDVSGYPSLRGSLGGITPIRKRLLLDLGQLGLPLDNLEGMALGPRLPDGSQSLVLVSDNNFSREQKNQFILLRLTGIRPA